MKIIEEQNNKIRELEAEISKLISLIEHKTVNAQYKDRLFKFIFGNPENKPWTLALYNAVNGTHYTNLNDLQFNTLEEALYMKMKNDISFIIHFEMNLWEHQSSFNPNMPFRFLEYASALYDKFAEATEKFNQYSRTLQKIPTPKCICFYNGTESQPETKTLYLSDAYDGKGDIEVEVTMLNINFGKNKELLDSCKPLYEYSWLIDTIRDYQKSGDALNVAVDKAVDEMPDGFIIKPLIIANRAEVKNMLIFEEFNEDKYKNLFIEEGREEGLKEGLKEGREEGLKEGRNEGRKEGIEKGRNERNKEVAADLIREGNMSASVIAKISKLSEDTVRRLADSLGVSVL